VASGEESSWLGFELELFRYDPRQWLLLTGNRLLVALLALLALTGVFAGVVFSGLVPLRRETPVLFLLFALIAANFTLIAIVTSLSQLVLSRRLEAPGEIREKMADTLSYREDVSRTTNREVMPVKADAFFLALYRSVRADIEELEGLQSQGRTRLAREELADLLEGLATHTDYVIRVLRRPASRLKHALFISLTADYENFVHRTWYLEAEHSDEFTERAAVPLRRLAETLEHLEVASRMFKTVFIESEVSELSRFLLYVGLPVQLAAVVVMLIYSAPTEGPPLALSTLRPVMVAVLSAGFAPFLLLSAYVVRLTVVARRTADSFPFSSQLDRTVREEDFTEER
jgi:hypothetical protein